MFVYYLVQVGTSVNARHHKTKNFYGAFVSRANANGTYQVYFLDGDVDEVRTQDNTMHGEIKLPLATKHNQKHATWLAYKGKLFYDEGTKDKTGKVLFEPGLFRICGVVEYNQNFLCARETGEDETKVEFDISYALRRIRVYREE